MKIPEMKVAGLLIDPSVKKKLKTLPDVPVLRVAVLGGGCSGFQYKIALGEVGDDDFVWQDDGVCVCVDPVSAPFLKGARLRFDTALVGSRFVIDNPNASSSCGCGLSFSM